MGALPLDVPTVLRTAVVHLGSGGATEEKAVAVPVNTVIPSKTQAVEAFVETKVEGPP